MVTVVLVMVVRVDTALLSIDDTVSQNAFNGVLATVVSVETTVVVEVVVTWVIMVLSGSVVPLLLLSSVKSSLRLDSSAEGIGEGAIRMILSTGLGLGSAD